MVWSQPATPASETLPMLMQKIRGILAPVTAVLSLGVLLPAAHAQCGANLKGFQPSAWSPAASGVHLLQAAFQPDDHFGPKSSIVGMWHVVFTARTMNGNSIPDMLLDNAIVVWHDDNTEIMNSGRPPQDGNFCLGVWQEIAPRTYQLNHFAWAGNAAPSGAPQGSVGEPIGPVHYRELVTVGPEGRHYSGSFLLEQYTTTGTVAVSFTGTLKATRITIDTSAQDLLQ